LETADARNHIQLKRAIMLALSWREPMTKEMKSTLFGTTLGALFVASAASVAGAAMPISDPSIIAMSQKIENGAVTLDYAYLPTNGYAVVYGVDKSGNPLKEPLGVKELAAGDHRGVKIAIKTDPPKGSTLWVSLYSDKDGKPGFSTQGDVSFWPGEIPRVNKITVE
jgi:hypothetical protein